MKNLLYTLVFLSIVSYSQNKPVGYKFIGDALVGDNPHVFYYGQPKEYYDAPIISHYNNSVTITTRELDTNARTVYDLQSNGVCNYIQQDPSQPRYLHAVFMVDRIGATGYPDRRTKYFFSNDTGNTWQYLGEVPNVRSGFPDLSIVKNTATQWLPVIANHSNAGTNTGVRTQLYVDIAPGIGGFVALDPAGTGDATDQPIWARVAGTNDNTSLIKYNFVASKNAGDTVFRNYIPGSGGYVPIPNAANAGSYAVARDVNKVLIAFISGDLNPGNEGDVYYIESTNAGVTFNPPVRIWDCNFATDSIGGLRSIDAIYYNGNPRIFFGLCKITQTGFFPNLPSSQRLWAPDINGGVPLIVDSRPGMTGSNSTNDVFVSCCRGVIGKSTNLLLYALWDVSRNDTSDLGNNYFDVYFSYSTNGGTNWIAAVQVTNTSGPLRDCRYASISNLNNYVGSGNHSWVYVTYQRDSIPGSQVNGAPPSVAKMMYVKIDVVVPNYPGIILLGNEIPNSFSLKQNYPNPFNPNTKIRFDIKSNGMSGKAKVKLVLYDVLGREVTILVNEQLAAGKYEVTFDAKGLQSGVYFYKFVTDGFTESKKMIVLK